MEQDQTLSEEVDEMKEQSTCTIADNLKSMREDARYSVETLADLLDVDTELITKWEVGAEEPTLSQSLLLSKLYGVPVNDLFYNVKVEEYIPNEKKDDFKYNARVNQLLHRSYWW